MNNIKHTHPLRDVALNLQTQVKAMDVITEGITIADASIPGMPLIYVNPAFEKLTGYTREEVVGLNCRFLQGEDTSAATIRLIRESLSKGEPCKVEILNYRKNGEPFWNLLSMAPIYDEQGTLTHFIGVQSDTTLRREIEHQLIKNNNLLLQQKRQMDDYVNNMESFAYSASHHIKDAVINMAEEAYYLMHNCKEIDEQCQLHLSDIIQQGGYIDRMLDDLMKFTGILHQALNITEQDMNHVVDHALSRIHKTFREYDVTVDAPMTFPTVHGDATQLAEMLYQLLHNAVRFNVERPRMVKVGMMDTLPENAPSQQKPVFYIKDNGAGIEPKFQEHVFRIFFQVPDVPTNFPGGTGAGLALAQKIIAMHGGHIWLESTPGQGTTVYFTLGERKESSSLLLP